MRIEVAWKPFNEKLDESVVVNMNLEWIYEGRSKGLRVSGKPIIKKAIVKAS